MRFYAVALGSIMAAILVAIVKADGYGYGGYGGSGYGGYGGGYGSGYGGYAGGYNMYGYGKGGYGGGGYGGYSGGYSKGKGIRSLVYFPVAVPTRPPIPPYLLAQEYNNNGILGGENSYLWVIGVGILLLLLLTGLNNNNG